MEYYQSYYLKNKDTMNESCKKYNKEHQDEIAKYKQTYYLKHKDEYSCRNRERYYRIKELKLMGLEDMRITI